MIKTLVRKTVPSKKYIYKRILSYRTTKQLEKIKQKYVKKLRNKILRKL